MIELVVFDMAGTTVHDNHEVEACFAKAAFETGLNVSPERILELQGYSKIEVFNMLWNEAYPNLAEAVLKNKVSNSYSVFCNILESHYLINGAKPTIGCLELFQYLKENNIKIGLTTGFYRKVTDIILAKLGWLKGLNSNYIGSNGSIIDVSIASDEVQHGRPKPDMIFKAMELLNITNHEKVAVIGDTPSDIIAGDSANVGYVAAITNGTHSAEQLKQFYPQIMVDSLREFQDYLANLIKTDSGIS